MLLNELLELNEMAELEELFEKEWSDAVTHRKPGTFAPKGTHSKSAEEIFKIYKRHRVSPHGDGSAIQMLQFFINRAGKRLKPERKQELEKAIRMLQADNAKMKAKEKKKDEKKDD